MSHVAYISRSLNRIIVEVPYNPDWAAAINYVIPSQHRKNSGGIWNFQLAWQNAIIEITKYYHPHNSITVSDFDDEMLFLLSWQKRWAQFLVDRHIQPKTSTPLVDGPHAELYLTKFAPQEVVVAAYRALSKMHHPDKGGDPARFRVIQKAYEEITND